MRRDIIFAGLYFLVSTAITWWFIIAGASLYHYDMQQMLLSCGIAGGKWGVQILAALVLLKERRWRFVRQIGFTCFAGSCILLPFCFSMQGDIAGINAFLLSLVLAVVVMLALYYYAVRRCGLPVIWYFTWVACLGIAISLQLTIVFHVLG